MVDEIRSKWCDDLEDLLQCPVCMERPNRWIYQCVQGHHICQICKPQLERCPTCMQNWSDSRNRLAEHLCSKLDEIKLSLIDPENEINKLLIPEKVSVSSQTDEQKGTATQSAVGPAPKKLDSHAAKAYPCKMGNCSVQLFYEPLLKHLQNTHAPEFSKLTSDGAVFEHSWIIDCVDQMVFDRVFSITNMGTFFLKLSTDIFLNFTGFILMAHNGFIAKHFTYQVEISCCQTHGPAIYTSEVCSCRTPTSVLRTKCLRIERPEMQRMIAHTNKLTCTLLLGKKPFSEDTETPNFRNVQKNKHYKNRPHPGKNGQNGTNYVPNFNRVSGGRTTPNNQGVQPLMAGSLPSNSRSSSYSNLVEVE